jgi:hypothetical protein
MRFGGALAGELALVAPVVLCHTLTANILGVEPNHERVKQLWDDALKEILYPLQNPGRTAEEWVGW